MIHQRACMLAGKVVQVKPQAPDIGGATVTVEDWYDRTAGFSWYLTPQPVCLYYAYRLGRGLLPVDDEVLLTRMAGTERVVLVHITELEDGAR